ncbi:MAG: hypothetical protein LC790_13335 [Actinobacteria bacterium]|nr:hypothetical protein [Actinomycetota bacterium]
MGSSAPARVLIVAKRTAATPPLIEAVRRRAASGPCTFTLLVPHASHGLRKLASADASDSETDESQAVLELALPLLEDAAGAEVESMIGDPSPLAAIQDAVNRRGFDEIILSTLPAHVSRWLKLDLPSKVQGLGLPVTHVEARARSS